MFIDLMIYYQRNPGVIREAEETKEKEIYEMDLNIELQKSSIISSHLPTLCNDAVNSTFTREIDLRSWASSKGNHFCHFDKLSFHLSFSFYLIFLFLLSSFKSWHYFFDIFSAQILNKNKARPMHCVWSDFEVMSVSFANVYCLVSMCIEVLQRKRFFVWQIY